MGKLAHSMRIAAVVAATCLASAAHATTRLDQKLIDARSVYRELLSSPDRSVPEALRRRCTCIAVIPHVIKGALGYGARYGQGVMSCRDDHGKWSPPSFISLAGGSVGFQIGAESTDLVLFFMSERGARSLLTSSKITLGGDVSLAAGPVGRSGEASTDLKLSAEIYSYAKSKGLFAGASIEGARLAANQRANAEYYGRRVSVKQLLLEHRAPKVPGAAEDFRRALP